MRYAGYNYALGNSILVDAEEKTLTLFKSNLNGQIFNLENPQVTKVTNQMVNGLINRLNSENYGFDTAKVIDLMIFEQIMTPEQRDKCTNTPSAILPHPVIIETDNYKDAIRGLCDYTYSYEWADKPESERPDINETLKYCEKFIRENNIGKDKPKNRESSGVER
ncbi:hypothetical protein FACS1894187_02470 [Synergistales bacterium]|nr:hypothetical protein FACS1894187_02470 [Synergistales bacterium]